MLFSKAVTGCLAMAVRATAADRDALFSNRPHLIEWRDDMFQDGGGQGPQSIIGGDEIVPGSRPYLVPVVGKYFCGGSLISPHAVMTAAHCVFSANEWSPPAWVDFHRHSWYNNTGVKRVFVNDRSQCGGDVVYHPEWSDYTFENDVAIIFLPEAINDIIPVQLNEDPNIPVSGAPLDVAGWGLTDPYIPYLSYVPNAVTLDYVTNDACSKKPYRWPAEWIEDSMICAVENGKGSCQGDSGGPVVIGKPESDGGGPQKPIVQVGIVSWGIIGCVDPRFPSVFTRVSEVADWVKDTVCERTGELCKSSKAGKTSKTKKVYPDCVKVPTYAPTEFPTTFSPTVTARPTTLHPTDMPTVTAQPVTPYPTYMPTTYWPTWVPTEAPMHRAKSDKLIEVFH
ncbi:hypothetical protein HJC23_010680 [Cyclotella cryptica]|uniref:Peptidase S1 domain-containing protein n=1 Tax=Cyclotella cryptica TaxID=29204 RepID=A0ABD3P9N3_9STRA|eukprot:CCRYP_016484-RG/>CCRYP_016484-RG protein AED:0.05 eAED:0.05 QI:283/1/1/1/0.7/0.54/11/5339/395